jgi:ecdysone receptor
MLRCSRRYDTGTDSIVFANNVPFTRENYNSAGLSNGDGLYNFCRSMCSMRVDNAEYAILSAIIIFSGEFFCVLVGEIFEFFLFLWFFF